MKHAIHTSRNTPTDKQCCRRCVMQYIATLLTATVCTKCQMCKPRTFTPPGTAATRGARVYTPPRMAAEPRTTTGITERHGHRRPQRSTRGKRSEQPPNARASSTKDHAVQNPRSRDEQRRKRTCQSHSARKEDEHNRETPLPPTIKNSPTVTPSESVPSTERAVEHIGSDTSDAAHCAKAIIRTAHGGTVLDGDPDCGTERVRSDEIGILQNAGTKAAAALQTDVRAPYLHPAREGGQNPHKPAKLT